MMMANFNNQTSQARSGQNVCIFETTRGTTYDCDISLSKGGLVIVSGQVAVNFYEWQPWTYIRATINPITGVIATFDISTTP
jgi:hypothetical protein